MTDTNHVEALRSVADCNHCLGCQDVALGALGGKDRGVSVGEVLGALLDIVSDYDDTACDRSGVIGVEVWARGQSVLEKAKHAGMF